MIIINYWLSLIDDFNSIIQLIIVIAFYLQLIGFCSQLESFF